MACTLTLSNEELAELEAVLHQDLNSSRDELHYTSRAGYKQDVKKHIQLIEGVLARIEKVRETAPPDTVPSPS